MHHGVEFTVVLIVCLALAVGVVARLFRGALRLPHTILVLLAGVATGLALEGSEHGHGVIARLEAGAHVSPDLIIFVFLPALVFESAYNLDGYAFRRNLGAVTLLAVPALLAATAATGAAMVGLTALLGWDWAWPAALVFGALISATDPVAVVAILRELGAPKRLGILIEGESLLNDGTAIVVFGVVLTVLVGGGFGEVDPAATVLDFGRVVSGGLLVGVGLAAAVSFCIARTFNDPSSEIAMTVVLAYACMVVAEGLLHVSGVMALVAAGLVLGGPGRTAISPEVQHFLREFWEMVAFIANTLIFFLVGLVVASQLGMANATDAVAIAGAYVAIVALRFAVTFAFKPAIGLVGRPVSNAQAAAMSWGGLRGAVSLALALMVAHNDGIAFELRRQILLVTAGVVALTIVVNGATAAWVLGKLGFAQTPPSRRKLQLAAVAEALDAVGQRVEEVAVSKQLPTVNWDEVETDLRERRAVVERETAEVDGQLAAATALERSCGLWLRALHVERQAYWRSFDTGTLGARATRILDREIEHQLDDLARGEFAPPAVRHPNLAMRTAWLRRGGAPRLTGVEFDRMALLYDLARAEHEAAAVVLEWLDGVEIELDVCAAIREVYLGYQRAGKERLEDLRDNLSEVVAAIETRLARRIQLNYERAEFRRLERRGALSEEAAAAELDRVDAEMKNLPRRPRRVELPETAVLCRNTPLFRALPEHIIDELARLTRERVVAPGQELFHEGESANSMFVVGRGVAELRTEASGLVATFSSGDIVGERALFTGEPRAGTVTARTTVTVGEISRSGFDHLMSAHPAVRRRFLEVFEKYA